MNFERDQPSPVKAQSSGSNSPYQRSVANSNLCQKSSLKMLHVRSPRPDALIEVHLTGVLLRVASRRLCCAGSLWPLLKGHYEELRCLQGPHAGPALRICRISRFYIHVVCINPRSPSKSFQDSHRRLLAMAAAGFLRVSLRFHR